MSASSAADHARRHPLEALGRVGYAVKGILYAVIGVLALDAAFGPGGPEGQTGAMKALADQPFGTALLWLVTLGLAAYALWRVVLAVADPEGEGDDLKGGARRAFYLVSALAYGSLSYSAYKVVSGAGASGGGSEERAETVLGLPGGRWLVGLIALGVLGYGAYQFVRAYRASFMDRFQLEGLAASRRDLVRGIGRGGLAARGVVYLLVGGFLAQAARQSDAAEAGGLDQALGTLRDQPYGPWLLALVAVGLVLYGVYCGLNAAYRTYEGQ